MTDLSKQQTGWCDDEDYDSEEGEGEFGLTESQIETKKADEATEQKSEKPKDQEECKQCFLNQIVVEKSIKTFDQG